jgi:hypothetical protein
MMFDGSTIILTLEENNLLKVWVDDIFKSAKLLYRGTRDGFGFNEYVSKTGNNTPVLCIIHSEYNHKFGFYTKLPLGVNRNNTW